MVAVQLILICGRCTTASRFSSYESEGIAAKCMSADATLEVKQNPSVRK